MADSGYDIADYRSIEPAFGTLATAQVFVEPYLFTGGGPSDSTLTILLFIYNYAFANSLGGDCPSAAALSIMLALFLGLLSAVHFRLTRSWSTS
jgi:multiple sugar transport system permease protein